MCPLCRAVHAARQLGPEVTSHLSAAMASLAQAATVLLATSGQGTAPTSDVEHIDVDDTWPEGE